MSTTAHSRSLAGIAVARIAFRRLSRFLRKREHGQELVEYAILIALIAVGLIGVLLVFRNAVGGVMNTTSTTISAQASSGYGDPGGSPPSSATPDPAPDSSAADNDSAGTDGVAATPR